MTVQEAIKIMQFYTDEDMREYYQDDFVKAHELAISALEKQVGKKPIANKRGYVDCPHCRSNLEVILDEISDPDYCFICGQAISWEDEDGK